MNSLLKMLKDAGIRREPTVMLNGLRFWNPDNKTEVKIYYDEGFCSYISGTEQGSFKHPTTFDDIPDQLIELLNEVDLSYMGQCT